MFGTFQTLVQKCAPGGLDENREIWRGLTPENGEHYWERPCTDALCRAAADLGCACRTISDRDIPNSMGRDGLASYYWDLHDYNK